MAQDTMSDYEGRRVLVTGAGAGIGRGIALRLGQAGAAVACADMAAPAAGQVARELEAMGRHGVAIVGDVAIEADVARIVDGAAEALGGIDVLVNNAGITIIKPFVESSVEEWDRTMNVNLRSMYLVTRRAIPWLEQAEEGSIVNLASMAAMRFTVPHVAYAASKSAIVAFTRDLAVELAAAGIRVNAVAPGPIATQIMGTLSDEQIDAAGLRFLLGRMGRPEDIAEAVAFLACERASYITGVTLPVTGGAELATRPLRPEDA
jgi:NAD(P)-dependent dehydrogenase (short-subunit alcohol dehydrogenase family)